MKQKITDALEILDCLYVKDDPEMIALIEEERIKGDIAQAVYDLRKMHKMTQKQLATEIGTTASAISRLEDTDCDCNHSITTLQKVARAFGQRLEIRFTKPSPVSAQKPQSNSNCWESMDHVILGKKSDPIVFAKSAQQSQEYYSDAWKSQNDFILNNETDTAEELQLVA